MLKVENITFSYRRKSRPVLDDFSLDIEAGGVYGLLGRNVAGKSTLLYLIAGLLTPKSGSVLFRGLNTRLRLPSVLSDIFIVPEEFTLPRISLGDYVKANARFYPNYSDEDLRRHLDIFGMSADLNLGALSMGQKKKAFMSFALACNTKYLLMDEPTNGLDIPSKAQFRKAITKYTREDSIILISTHQVRDIENIIVPIIILDRQDVLLNATLEEISQKLYFDYSSERIEDALYSEMVPGGNIQVCLNQSGEDSKVNLEALFNTVHQNKEIIKVIFNK